MTATQTETPAGQAKFPVSDYRIEHYYANGACIRPLPARSFDTDQATAIAEWFKAAGWEVITRGPSAVKAVNDIGRTANDIPEPYTAAQRRRDERQLAAEAKESAKHAAQQDCLKNTAAGRFVKESFGDTLNGYNSTKLAQYLDGSAARFEGMLTHRSVDVFAALGITTQVTTEALAELKRKFEAASTATA